MAQNTSVALGDYFEQFIRTIIAEGRYKNASEVIRAGLRLLEKEENEIEALKKAIQEGLDSPVMEDFDFEMHLAALKAKAIKHD
ncbi:MAG: type II toxin-antitoxin system ParD family antitoxin [Chitinophagales bacterium]|nr:type II toxin-antitoxin system ParD family antitoxin [Chitinophagales bacterium]